MHIDLNKIYYVGEYKFQNFAALDPNWIEKIRVWRNHPEIRKLMYNKEEISLEEHNKFISSLPTQKDKLYWLVFKKNQPIGVVSVVDIDIIKESGQSGFYLIPECLDSGLGLEFVITINYFLYHEIKFKHLFGRTQINNKNALFINYYLGCIIRPEIITIDGMSYVEVDGFSDTFLSKYPSLNDLNELISDSHSLIKSLKEFNKVYNTKIKNINYGN